MWILFLSIFLSLTSPNWHNFPFERLKINLFSSWPIHQKIYNLALYFAGLTTVGCQNCFSSFDEKIVIVAQRFSGNFHLQIQTWDCFKSVLYLSSYCKVYAQFFPKFWLCVQNFAKILLINQPNCTKKFLEQGYQTGKFEL